ncbi:hypothetical protein SHI21_13400 [Bacteriovorax sp. PP10]|uniref:OmpA family protein n=1 Tax=Bacteriovorax antarcticus TaxID=3088717 RepID=A0ABU5VVZ5_9BACT|nr:hypothetical protein [Bacteriovorax sp. PP10]MEA9357214.1 hypothetical protein [Bacteriovorax sp. PP10]
MKTCNLFATILISSFIVGNPVVHAETMHMKEKNMQSKSTKYYKHTTENAVLDFNKDTASLSTMDQDKLNNLVKSAKEKGEITKIEVAVWSDKEHPAKGDLSKPDITLAENRATHIKDILKKDIGHTRHVKVFNMAEGSNMVARMFHTPTAELNSEFAKRSKDSMRSEDFQIIKKEGAPSKAVVIFTIRERSNY